VSTTFIGSDSFSFGDAGASSYRDASWFLSAATPSSVSRWAQEPSETERGRATPYRISMGRPQT
jgi:hypothetical protein